jgi:hypothetical protein
MEQKMRSLIIAAAMLLPTGAWAQPDAINGTSTVRVQRGIASVYKIDTEQSFKSVNIGDSRIADIVPLTDRSLLIQGHVTGTTNLIFLNSQSIPIKEVIVTVDEQGAGFVRIHNKAQVNSYTAFTCWNNGCQFVGENTVAEPAPLPRGNYSQNYNQNPGSGTQAPAPANIPLDR